MVITSASHAEGHEFEPHQDLIFESFCSFHLFLLMCECQVKVPTTYHFYAIFYIEQQLYAYVNTTTLAQLYKPTSIQQILLPYLCLLSKLLDINLWHSKHHIK